MEKQQFTEEIEEMQAVILPAKEERIGGGEARTIILQVDNNEDEESIDIIHMMESMGRRWKAFAYLLIAAVCFGFLVAAVITVAGSLFGKENYASAVITFSFDGIEEGMDPNGAPFDVNKLKSTQVVNRALEMLGWTGKDVDSIRSNIKLEGVIPDAVKQKIAVINTVAEDAAEYYTNIEKLDYFPSQYTVTLYRCCGLSRSETCELLDAVMASYREYFMDSYANVETLGKITAVMNIESYDYLQAADMLEREIKTMQNYVEAKAKEAPDFRANVTGLSFSDLAGSIDAIRQLDLNNFISFVQSNQLTKDAGVQVDYYRYQIEQYNMQIQENQSQLFEIEQMIQNYQKDPVIVMSNQESVTESSQKNEYYDSLLEKKLALTEEISALNSSLNEAYLRISALNESSDRAAKEEDYQYADGLLAGLLDTVNAWAEIVQQTAEEYYETEAYASAYRISIPAQYNGAGGLGELVKRMAVCGGIAALLVVAAWGMAGLKSEIMRMRSSAADKK